MMLGRVPAPRNPHQRVFVVTLLSQTMASSALRRPWLFCCQPFKYGTLSAEYTYWLKEFTHYLPYLQHAPHRKIHALIGLRVH